MLATAKPSIAPVEKSFYIHVCEERNIPGIDTASKLLLEMRSSGCPTIEEGKVIIKSSNIFFLVPFRWL